MARKKKQGQLHGKVESYTKTAGIAQAPEPKPEAERATAVVELPLGDVAPTEYLSRHVESRLKTLEQRRVMKRLLRGLQQSGATTKDGRPVQRVGEAVRYVLEQISDSDRPV